MYGVQYEAILVGPLKVQCNFNKKSGDLVSGLLEQSNVTFKVISTEMVTLGRICLELGPFINYVHRVRPMPG